MGNSNDKQLEKICDNIKDVLKQSPCIKDGLILANLFIYDYDKKNVYTPETENINGEKVPAGLKTELNQTVYNVLEGVKNDEVYSLVDYFSYNERNTTHISFGNDQLNSDNFKKEFINQLNENKSTTKLNNTLGYYYCFYYEIKSFLPESRQICFSFIRPADDLFRKFPGLVFLITTVNPQDLGFKCAVEHIELLMIKSVAKYYEKRAIKHARRSAIAAIMARNMSHNIGSHVIPRTSIERIRKRFLELEKHENMIPSIPEILEVCSTLKAKMDTYIQEKADFLAEITTQPSASMKPSGFFEGVVLPFISNTALMDSIAQNEGLKYRTISENSLKFRVLFKQNGAIEEVFGKFCPRSSDPNESNPNKVFFVPNNKGLMGLPYSCHCHCKDCKYKPREAERNTPKSFDEMRAERTGDCAAAFVGMENKNKNKMVDLNVALPGPNGAHAFYGFMENFIRNAAKHNHDQLKDGNELDITILVEDDGDNDYYKIRVYDNLSNFKVHAYTLNTDNTRKLNYDPKKKKLAEILESEDLICEDGKLKQDYWGLSEMRVNASLLNGTRDFSDITEVLKIEAVNKENDEPFTTIEKDEKTGKSFVTNIDDATDESLMAYSFKIMKAKQVCMIGNFPEIEKNDAFKKAGIDVFKTWDDFLSGASGGGSSESQAKSSYNFAVVDENVIGKKEKEETLKGSTLDKNIHRLPFRMFVHSDQDATFENRALTIPKIIVVSFSLPEELIEKCWQVWITHCAKGATPIVHYYAEQSKDNESPTKDLIPIASQWDADNKKMDFKVWYNVDGGQESCGGAACNNPINLAYDRHGTLLGQLPTEDLLIASYSFYFDKQNDDFSRLFQINTEEKPFSLPYRLAEAGLLKILIIDERIGDNSLDFVTGKAVLYNDTINAAPDDNQELRNSMRKWHLDAACQIWICTEWNYNETPVWKVTDNSNDLFRPTCKVSFDSSAEKESRLKVEWHTSNPEDIRKKVGTDTFADNDDTLKPDVVLIHQGIIDNTIKNSLESVSGPQKKRIRDFLKQLKEEVPYVIVHSGRGVPPLMPKTQEFLPFSSLQEYVDKSRPAKLSLVEHLMSLSANEEEDSNE
jgi:hypothetical protein